MSVFTKVKVNKPKYNNFNLSHDRKFSLQFGQITPILCMDTIPGDKIKMNTSQMLRFAPMLAPIMHQVSVYTHFFFVPNRILWDGWQDFITGGENGSESPVFPTFNPYPSGIQEASLADYLGLPTIAPQGLGQTLSAQFSAFPFAAYQMIWNEYYRDQNLQDDAFNKPDVQLIDGDNSANTGLFDLRYRAWQHDYFTSALPFTQKGPEATIPLGSTADVNFVQTGSNTDQVFDVLGNPILNSGGFSTDSSGNLISSPLTPATIDNAANLQVDLSSATAASINDLRTAFRLQEWLEINARAGSRYNEAIKAHFGVTTSDSRLQRPEFLGGGRTPVTISEVLQTSGNDQEPTPQGNMAGHGISVGANNSFSYRCEEWGYVIGLMTIMPKSSYQQGVPKHFLKFDKFDYFWKQFAHLGEQPIEKQEIYFDATDNQNEETFGYTPRYAEYKYMNSSVHGAYKTSLDFWHMGRIFQGRPELNGAFLEVSSEQTDRIFAVQSEEQLYCHVYHKIRAKRPMPFFGTPYL